jgi:hypothetical protein
VSFNLYLIFPVITLHDLLLNCFELRSFPSVLSSSCHLFLSHICRSEILLDHNPCPIPFLYTTLSAHPVTSIADFRRILSSAELLLSTFVLSPSTSFHPLFLPPSHLSPLISSIYLPPSRAPSLALFYLSDDLELLMVGTPHLDFRELENTTQYIGSGTTAPCAAPTLLPLESFTLFGYGIEYGVVE